MYGMTERKVTGTRFAQGTHDSAVYVIGDGNARIRTGRSAASTAGKNARYIVVVDGVCFRAEKMFARARVLAVGKFETFAVM